MSWDDPRELQPGDLARSAPMLLHDPDEDRVRYVRQAEAAGLIDRTPPLDPREAILAAKRAAGRTGPPLARLDGRRARR